MANKSIKVAFERMWQHIVVALEKKSDSTHTHDEYLVVDDIADKADKTYVDEQLATKSDSGHAHDEYLVADDIVDKATVTYVDEQLAKKSDSTHVHEQYVSKETGKSLSANDFTDEYKTKLDGIASGANKITVDSALSDASENPVKNKVVNAAITNLSDSKVDKIDGYRLISTSEADKLEALVLGDSGQVEISGKVNADNVEGLDEKLALKSNIGHTHTMSNITDVVATAAELNYMSGVTSNVQEQIDGLSEYVDSAASNKVDKETGKGLSTNDFTEDYKDKLDSIAEGANNYTLPVATTTALGGVKISTDSPSVDAMGFDTFVTGNDNRLLTLIRPASNEVEGYVKTTSTVTDVTDYTPCPVVNGVPYYLDATDDIADKADKTYVDTNFNGMATAIDNHKADAVVHVTSNERMAWNNKTDKTYVDEQLTTKVDKEIGKGLSANDFTEEYKNKLDSIEEDANNYTLPVATTTTLGGVVVSASIPPVDAIGFDTFVNSSNNNKLITLIRPASNTTEGYVRTTSAVTDVADYTPCPVIGGVPYYLDYTLPEIVNTSTVETTGTTISFTIGDRSFSQSVAIDGGSMSVESAGKLTTARNIIVSGDVSGSTIFDGSTDVVINATVNKSLLSGFADGETALDHYDDNIAHITANERTAWNNKVDKSYMNVKIDSVILVNEASTETTIPYYRQGDIIQLNGSVDIFNQMRDNMGRSIELVVIKDDNFLLPIHNYVGGAIIFAFMV